MLMVSFCTSDVTDRVVKALEIGKSDCYRVGVKGERRRNIRQRSTRARKSGASLANDLAAGAEVAALPQLEGAA